MTNLFKGYGTYLTGAVGVIFGGGDLVNMWNQLSTGEAATITLLGFGLVFLRRAVEGLGLNLSVKK